MRPVDMDYHKNKGDMIIHECVKCKKRIPNKIAPDDAFLDFVRKLNSTKTL